MLSAFNNHFEEFVEDILSIFPGNRDILTAKNSMQTLRKMNPKIIISFWQSYIVATYGAQIIQGDCDFFLNKDYTLDINTHSDGGGTNSTQLINAIERLKKPLSELNQDQLDKCVKYIQNLSQLANLYV